MSLIKCEIIFNTTYSEETSDDFWISNHLALKYVYFLKYYQNSFKKGVFYRTHIPWDKKMGASLPCDSLQCVDMNTRFNKRAKLQN